MQYGGGHRFMKLFHKIPLFFEGWLPLFKWESSFSNKLDGPLSLWAGPQINTYMSSVTLDISSLMVYFLVQFELNKATEPVCCKQCHVMERDRNWPHLTITFFKWESRFFCFTSLVAHSCPVL